jgi:hypothetical protein
MDKECRYIVDYDLVIQCSSGNGNPTADLHSRLRPCETDETSALDMFAAQWQNAATNI